MEKRGKRKIILYSATWCPHCKRAKDFFKKHKINFTNKDVEDKKNAEEMVRKSKQTGIPVLEISGKITVGFDENEVRKECGV
ncbi:NrdH-redoxin [Candidatus Pacearchaeota archaeon]|nr:NrdH-redoxin [Candidatus Pacearchaeota archaeon]